VYRIRAERALSGHRWVQAQLVRRLGRAIAALQG
jgi:hypothetical protein